MMKALLNVDSSLDAHETCMWQCHDTEVAPSRQHFFFNKKTTARLLSRVGVPKEYSFAHPDLGRAPCTSTPTPWSRTQKK